MKYALTGKIIAIKQQRLIPPYIERGYKKRG